MKAIFLIVFIGLFAHAHLQTIGKSCGVVPDGVAVAHMKICSRYLVCQDGVLHEKTCSWNYGYNPKTAQCEYNTSCWNTGVTDPSVLCANHPSGSYLPGLTGCREFYYCYLGGGMKSTCPVGYAFDSQKSSCSPSTRACANQTD